MKIKSGASPISDVTVLMATNKINQWLNDAVESVLDSDDSTHLLLVLDGVNLGEENWSSNSRVAVVSLGTSSGLADALNFGLSHIKTEYVARLDADDIALPGRFVWQSEYLRDNPEVALVCGLAHLIDENGVSLGVRLPGGEFMCADLRYKLLERNPIIHPAVMYRTSEVKALGGYGQGLRAMEDYELWLRLANVGSIVTVQNDAIKYRIHSGQMTHSAAPFGEHIDLISKNRLKLASELRVSLLRTFAFIFFWRSYQIVRFLKAAISKFFRGD